MAVFVIIAVTSAPLYMTILGRVTLLLNGEAESCKVQHKKWNDLSDSCRFQRYPRLETRLAALAHGFASCLLPDSNGKSALFPCLKIPDCNVPFSLDDNGGLCNNIGPF